MGKLATYPKPANLRLLINLRILILEGRKSGGKYQKKGANYTIVAENVTDDLG